MPTAGIESFIYDRVYRIWRGSDDRKLTISEWLEEWERDNLIRSPEATLGEFFSSWWTDVRRHGRFGVSGDHGQPDLVDLCLSLSKIRYGEDDLGVSYSSVPSYLSLPSFPLFVSLVDRPGLESGQCGP
jgi:hypothetical protein